jgi:hypothetical protein
MAILCQAKRLDICFGFCYILGMGAKQRLQNLRLAGMKITELARIIGTSDGQIVRWCRENTRLNAASEFMINAKLDEYGRKEP